MKKKVFSTIVAVATTMFVVSVQAANHWYVDKNSTAGTHDGAQASPFLTIQEGLDQTKDNDVVHIAKGHYYISNTLTIGKGNITLVGDDGIATNTIIDAQQLTNCVTCTGYDPKLYNLTFTNGLCRVTSDFNGGGLRLERGRAVVSNCVVTCCAVIGTGDIKLNGGGIYASGVDLIDSLVENCSLSNTVESSDGLSCCGGGVYNVSNGRRSIVRNCSVFAARTGGYNNMRGGGASDGNWYDSSFISNRVINPLVTNNVYNCDGGALLCRFSPVVSNCYFEGNYITGKGAAAYLEKESQVINSSFIGNIGSDNAGSALYASKVYGCYFDGNNLPGTGAEAFGGALALNSGDPRIASGCVFRNNTGIENSAVYAAMKTVITNCVFEGNHAGLSKSKTAAVVYYRNQVLSPVLTDCAFINNDSSSTSADGGVIHMDGTSNATVRSCLFVSNVVPNVMHIKEWDTARTDIKQGRSWCGRIENCTIVDNTLFGTDPYAIRASQYDLFQYNNLIFNNVISGTETVKALQNWHTGTNVVRNCYIDSRALYAAGYNKDGNVIGADPGFKNAAGGDYRLAVNSACRNVGTNLAWMAEEGAKDMGCGFRVTRPTTITAFDKTFNVGVKVEKIDPCARIVKGTVDIGCFEYWSPSGTYISVR